MTEAVRCASCGYGPRDGYGGRPVARVRRRAKEAHDPDLTEGQGRAVMGIVRN